ncbi:MAG: DUF6288 domain-containing protein [Armatimonadota bacterium]
MTLSRRHSFATLAILFVVSLAAPRACAQQGKPPPLDFTKGDQPDKTHDWTLGATGARGWMWAWRHRTTDARQILVTEVEAGSPADGVLEKGDVLLGVGGKPFDDDARIQFARALTEAEKTENGGVLRLLRWRDGSTEEVTLRLKVLGSYSDTAPYNCEKSRAIFEQGCRALAETGLDRVSIPNDLNALALLASGEEQYRPLVADYAKRVAEIQQEGLYSWHYAYANLFLAEYYLATRDAAVFPGLRRVSLEIARGQSNVGTWGHRFAKPNGILRGYGAMNQPGLVLTISMVLAKKAGVRHRDLNRAIEKAAKFVRWYVGKGSIPYGDHDPWMEHDDNGTNATGAVLFDLLKDAEATAFFSRMMTASYVERETGHTGNFFNMLWALPGVSRAGPEAAAAHMKELTWYFDLARRWDGRFLYQGVPANTGGHSYGSWDSTGAYLLTYALPRKSLYILGKEPSVVPALSRQEAAEVIQAGRNFTFWDRGTSYDAFSDDELFEKLGSWSPVVRYRAAESLSHHEGDYASRLAALLDGDDRDAKLGACEAIARLGPRAGPGLTEKLRAMLATEDSWLLMMVVRALASQQTADKDEIANDLLRVALRDLPDDPRRWTRRFVTSALFVKDSAYGGGLLVDSLGDVDRRLLFKGVKSILQNEDGRTRGRVAPLYKLLPEEPNFGDYLPVILRAIREPSPSDVMFSDGIRLAGLDLLSSLHIREGMQLCVDLIEPDRWGQGRRAPRCLDYLARYGGNAREVMPQLLEVRAQLLERAGNKPDDPSVVKADEVIAAINGDQDPPPLRRVRDFRAQRR